MGTTKRRSTAGRFIRLWFACDLVLAIFPPFHWWASEPSSLFGAPRVLVYLFGTSAFVAASVLAAYWLDPAGDGAR